MNAYKNDNIYHQLGVCVTPFLNIYRHYAHFLLNNLKCLKETPITEILILSSDFIAGK